MANFNVSCTAVLTVSEQGIVKIWSAYTGVCILTLSRMEGTDNYITTASFSANGTLILITARRHVKIWSAATGQCHQKLTGSEFRALSIDRWERSEYMEHHNRATHVGIRGA